MNQCAIVGATATGIALAARLHHIHGYKTILLDRKGAYSDLCFFEGYGQTLKFPTQDVTDVQLTPLGGVLFFAVGAFDLQVSFERFLNYIPKNTLIVVLTNAGCIDMVCQMQKLFPQFTWRIGAGTPEVEIRSYRIFNLKKEASYFWGPVTQSSQFTLEPFEKKLLEGDVHFSWQIKPFEKLKEKWIFDLTLNTISSAKALEKNLHLLSDLIYLKEVLKEACSLSQEIWGPLSKNFEWYYSQLISYISANLNEENLMAQMVRLRERTEQDFYSKIAAHNPQYPKLSQLDALLGQRSKKN